MSLEQNVLEDRDEIKIKFFVKIIKIIIKDNTATGQNALSSDQKTCFDLKQKRFGGFVRNLFRLLKGQYGTNHSIPDSCFMYIWKIFFFDRILKTRITWVKPWVLWSKFARKIGKCNTGQKNHIKDNVGQIVLPPILFLKCIWNRK